MEAKMTIGAMFPAPLTATTVNDIQNFNCAGGNLELLHAALRARQQESSYADRPEAAHPVFCVFYSIAGNYCIYVRALQRMLHQKVRAAAPARIRIAILAVECQRTHAPLIPNSLRSASTNPPAPTGMIVLGHSCPKSSTLSIGNV